MGQVGKKELTGYPSIDKPWLKFYDRDLISKTHIPNQTVYQYIKDCNKEYFDDLALIYFGAKITYRELFNSIDKIARCLTQNGVRKGTPVLICMTGTPETVALILACSKIGACAFMLNPTFEEKHLTEVIHNTSAEMLFCMDVLYDTISVSVMKSAVRQVVVVPAVASLPLPLRVMSSIKYSTIFQKNKTNNKLFRSWKCFLQDDKCGDIVECDDENAPLAVVYSSGTTGKPKGIIHTNKSYVALSVEYQCNGYPFKRRDKFLYCLVSFIAAGLSYTLLAPLAQGITIILDPIYSQENFIKDMLKWKPNIGAGTKSFWYALINDPRTKNIDLSALKLPVSGGEPVFERDKDNINNFLLEHGCHAKLYVGWGMSELNATITTTAVEGNSSGSAGIPLPHIVCSAFDVDSDQECMYGQYGELRVISPCTMKEYFKNNKATEEFFWTDKDEKCWCKSGDIGYLNEDGEVFVLGRSNDCFMTENRKRIYLFDIENVILADDNVQSCKVVAMQINQCSIPVAHIILADECKMNHDEFIIQIEKLCSEKLTKEAIPKLYKIRSFFPLTASGKRDIDQLLSEKDNFFEVNGNVVSNYIF